MKIEHNEYTKRLIEQNAFQIVTYEEPVDILDENGNITRREIRRITKFIDTRPYVKTFVNSCLETYKAFKGNPKTQIYFIIQYLLKGYINKQYVELSYDVYLNICYENNLDILPQSVFSRAIQFCIKKGFIAKTNKRSIYAINTEKFYNGRIVGTPEEM